MSGEPKRPRRACVLAAEARPVPANPSPAEHQSTRQRPSGRVLIVHANAKPYGYGPSGAASDSIAVGTAACKAKASNREFNFPCAAYEAMRDSGKPFSGDPKINKLLPLPRPTYTEFINRCAPCAMPAHAPWPTLVPIVLCWRCSAKRAKMIDRLDFLFCPADAPRPPLIAPTYEIIVWCGVSFRRFTRIWTPERSHFFSAAFQGRALTALCCAHRLRGVATLGVLPTDILLDIIAQSAEKHESSKEEYDDLATVISGARHLFLPAPGSSGLRESLFDAVFGL